MTGGDDVWTRWAGLALITASLASGCKPNATASTCETQDDCDDGQVCSDGVCSDEDDTDPAGSATSTSTSTSTSSAGSTTSPDPTSSDSVGGPTTGATGTSGGGPLTCEGPNCAVDILFVVDNSGTMAEEQRSIGGAMAGLEAALRARSLDVQVMFTTVDFGNLLCTPFQPQDYEPARGAPISTSCTDRLSDFTGLGNGGADVPQACTDVCPTAAAPAGDPFVAFDSTTTNAPEVDEVDVDGDGELDSPTAMTMACLAPQGINGCGYESPLENMLQALDPAAQWNSADRPFLREGAALAIAIVTDEADCSVQSSSLMGNPAYMENHPTTGSPQPSSALCWNAGVACNGPDEDGVYSDCASADLGELQPVARYTDYLIDELRDNQGKDVVMLGVLGVPPVTAHANETPFNPTAGGVINLAYRNWVDGPFPDGDILPEDAAAGLDADDKQFDFGVGPGCTVVDDGHAGQAIPPVRLREICESLDLGSDAADLRCCLESVCDDDYSGAMACLVGLIDNVSG